MNILYYDKNNCKSQELQMIYENIKALHESGRIEDTIILPKFCDFDENISFEDFEKIYEIVHDKYIKMKAEYNLLHEHDNSIAEQLVKTIKE